MRTALLAVLLCGPAAAQTGLPGYDKPADPAPAAAAPAASTAAAVAVSTAPPSIDDVAGHGVKRAGGDAPKPKLARPIRATIHKDAKDWEPLSLREGGVPGGGENSVALKVVKVSGRMKGENTKSRSFAAMRNGRKNSRWLVISVHPKSLERRRTHFEVRFKIVEGFVEEAVAAAVTITDRRAPPPAKRPLDSFELREQGIEYQEENPGSGSITVSELDPKPSASASNAGRLEKAEFADKDFGFVNFSWSAKGVAGK